MRTILSILSLLGVLTTTPVAAATFTVNNTTMTFAQAIAAANGAGVGSHTINFAASLNGTSIGSSNYTQYVITNSNITIDASGLNIVFRGTAVPTVAYGITIASSAENTTIRGLTFQNFTSRCINVDNSLGVKIFACRFGTDASGGTANSNISYGIYAVGSGKIQIGSSAVADRNYFGDCSSFAIYLATCTGTSILGNYFGIASDGVTVHTYNNANGIYVSNCSSTQIGRNSVTQRNLFSGNNAAANTAIEINGTNNVNAEISGNLFGYQVDGTTNLMANNRYDGIVISGNARNILTAYNRFATTTSSPYDLAIGTTSYIGNKLRRNSFESHSGGPDDNLMATNVTRPIIYSSSNTIIKGKGAPGDSIEVYYSNSYAVSGLTFIGATVVDANGKWKIAGTFTSGQYVSVTATNNTNNTTSWFVTHTSTIYTCANIANVSANTICKNAYLTTTGYVLYGSIGTTNPTNAAIWTSNGTGTFTNGALYNPSGNTRYILSAADMAGSGVSFTLTTTDTNCVNTTSTGVTTLVNLPAITKGADQFLCTNNTTITGTPAYTYNTWSSLDNPSNVSITNGGTNTASFTFNATGSYRIQRSVMIIVSAAYCYNYDTMVVTYRPTPVPPTGVTLNTISQKPVSFTVTGAPGEILTASYFSNSASPVGASSVTSSGSTLTYVTSGTFYGAGSFYYNLTNQCGPNSIGSISVNVQNAPPVAVTRPAVQTIRKENNTVVIYAPDYFTDVNGDITPSSVQIYINPASTAKATINTPLAGYITLDYTFTAKSADWVDMDSLFVIVNDAKPTRDTSIVRIYRGRNLTNPAEADDIVVYEGISPDGDGVNDFLRIVNLSDYNNDVTVYDRWGDKVWEGKNYNNTSVRFEGNGNISNYNPLPNGTYFYVIKNKSRSDNDEKAGLSSGFVIISRPE